MNLTNRMRRQVSVWMAASLAGAFFLTLLFSVLFRDRPPDLPEAAENAVGGTLSVAIGLIDESAPAVPVFLTREERIEQVPIEAYVRGVVAAEMPIDFELEALKAQAIAARTYIVRRMMERDSSHVPVQGAIVTDTVSHQVFMAEDELLARWSGKEAAVNMEKLNRAVVETLGQVITYEGKPINAVFFSTSNGYTENSEDYWEEALPYLRSVPSPWDAPLSPRYIETRVMSYTAFLNKLGIDEASAGSAAWEGAVIVPTEGKRVDTVEIAGKVLTGREVRERLGLQSSHFEWRSRNGEIEITTYGYGHGVGMSQWGAHGMAKEGWSAQEIIEHYYTGVQLSLLANTSN